MKILLWYNSKKQVAVFAVLTAGGLRWMEEGPMRAFLKSQYPGIDADKALAAADGRPGVRRASWY